MIHKHFPRLKRAINVAFEKVGIANGSIRLGTIGASRGVRSRGSRAVVAMARRTNSKRCGLALKIGDIKMVKYSESKDCTRSRHGGCIEADIHQLGLQRIILERFAPAETDTQFVNASSINYYQDWAV